MCATVGLPNVNVEYLGQHVAGRGEEGAGEEGQDHGQCPDQGQFLTFDSEDRTKHWTVLLPHPLHSQLLLIIRVSAPVSPPQGSPP